MYKSKMIFIQHRINTVEGLNLLNPAFGAEVDVRSWGPDLHLQHDPFIKGDLVTHYLDRWVHLMVSGPLILNVKEDGLEETLAHELSVRGISNYFFLDSALPTLVRLSQKEGLSRFAIRYSKYEPLEQVSRFLDRVDWVWVDGFDGEYPDVKALRARSDRPRLCLVSPELQKRDKAEIGALRDLRHDIDAVCTKHPELWA